MSENVAEEQRAKAYRAQARRRAAAVEARACALGGDSAAARAVRESWQPVLDYQREQRDAVQEA